MLKKLLVSTLASLTVVVFMPAVAFAHVIVTPNQAGIGAELLFNVSVPNEQQTPVVNVKLAIPAGVTNVTPTVTNGWTIQTTSKNSDVATIIWTGGNIPVGQRQDFSFSAQAPGSATELDWKAYQTYGDGTVVHWDQKPTGSDDASGNAGPYSVTHVVNDLTPAPTKNVNNNTLPLALSVVAVVISVSGLLVRKKTT